MKPQPLIAAFAKVEGSEPEIDDLKLRIDDFFQSNPYELASKINPQRTEVTWRFKLVRSLPDRLCVKTGHILHDLRSSLDQIACAVAIQNGKSEDGVWFPICRNINEFETELRKQKKAAARCHRHDQNIAAIQTR
jgi:hypothetical protein